MNKRYRTPRDRAEVLGWAFLWEHTSTEIWGEVYEVRLIDRYGRILATGASNGGVSWEEAAALEGTMLDEVLSHL